MTEKPKYILRIPVWSDLGNCWNYEMVDLDDDPREKSRVMIETLTRHLDEAECDREYNAGLVSERDAELACLREENEKLKRAMEPIKKVYQMLIDYPITRVLTHQEIKMADAIKTAVGLLNEK